MTGKELSRVFRELVSYLGGSVSTVYVRTYDRTGGDPMSGEPPEPLYSDTEIVPAPIVLDEPRRSAVAEGEVVAGAREVVGYKRVVAVAETQVGVGDFLVIEGEEYAVVRVMAPVLFGAVQLKLILGRKVLA
ncbi:MAG: hypothetical protein B1H03_04155 [Planctomycetales bacterium 4484_113]|nr:MAG: hypothetical protein B1H03_04155 [Planctomycetales bacterium 4484_113]